MKNVASSFSLLFTFIAFMFFNNCFGQTNQSNITISAAATSGGSFTGTAPTRAFTVTADNAVINTTSLATELLTSSVTISTARTGGTQAGDISFTAAVTAAATTSVAKVLTLTAGGSITIGSTITLTPATPTSNGGGRLPTGITMVAASNVSITAAVSTKGGAAFAATLSSGGVGGAGGAIAITAGGSFSNTAAGTIISNGGDGKSNDASTRSGGAGGAVSVSSTSSLILTGTITSTGGAGAQFLSNNVGNGGTGGTINLTSNPANVAISAVLAANGGNGVTSTGGDISITGAGGITITAAINSTTGSNLANGSLTINDGATTVTSGGVNDGQTAGVITVNNFTKNGAGNFNMSGNNAYVGNTTVNAGKIRVSNSVTGTSSGAFGTNPLSIATITLNNAGLEFNNATFARAIAVTGNTSMDGFGAARAVTPAISGSGTLTIGANTVAGDAGQDLSLGGVISGSIALVKSFSSALTLTATNTFTGAKTMNAGTLNINNSNALGTIAGTFSIAGGALDNTTAAAITTLNYIQTWSGDFAFTGTQSLNLGTGTVTMSASRQLTVNGSTLTSGGIISAPTLNLTKLGAGILHLGATAKTFSSVTISAGTLTSTSSTLSIAGNLVNNGVYTANGGTAVFNGSTQSISGTTATTAFSTLTVLNGSVTTGVSAITATTFNINSGGKFIQQAGTTIPGTTKNFVSGSTYELQAVGVTFSGSTYGTLIINFTSGNTNASGNLTSVLNNLIIQNTGTGSFRLSANTSPVINIAGNIIINAGKLNVVTGTGTPTLTLNGDVQLNGGTFQPMTGAGIPSIFMKGNWINNGATFTAGSSNISFNSTAAPQNISGTSPNNFFNLTNSNTDPSGLSLDNDITVTGVLSFSSASNGLFSTGTNTVFVSNNSTAAVVQPGAGYVIGNLKRTIAAAGGIYTFPVGSFLGYTPASLSFNSGNTAGNVNVTTTDGVSANYPSTLSATNQLARTWTITNAGSGIFNSNAIFTFLPDDLLNGAAASNLKGYKFDAPSTYAYSANTSNAANTFSFNGITSFSEFGAGECSGGLAVSGIVTNVTCNAGTDGSIITTVTGNTTPVTYLWNTAPVQTTPDLLNITAGSYTVTVTEQTTCTATNSFTVTEPAAVPPPGSGGNQTICSNGNPSQTLTATATSSFTINWYSVASGGTIVSNPVQTGVGTITYYAEAFDGICTSHTRTAVTLTINPVPAAPTSGGNQTVCSDGSATQTLTATATSAATITWYDAATGGNIVANPQQTGVGTATYYAEANDGTCSSLARTSVTLTINPVPAAPSASNQTVCSNGSPSQTLTATATGGTITWYDAAGGGNIVTSPTQVGVGSSTYYAEASDGTCSSLSRTAVTLTINPVPAAPTSGGNQTVCSDGSATQTLTATATSAATITWYDAATGGNIVANPQQTGVGTVTYYAAANDGTCSSLVRTAVTLTINPVPAAPSASNQTVCSNGNPSQTLTATATGGTITWYDAASGGNIVTSPTQVGVGSSTYYAEASDGTCSSLSRTAVTLTINPVPAAPTSGGNQTVCSDGSATQTLTATATSATTITWYDAATGGNIVANPQQTGVGTVTYYAEANDRTCSSLVRTAVTLTINPLPATATVNVTQPNCATSTGTITITSPTGAGFMYNIGSGFQGSPVFAGLTPGTYNNINAKNNFGCTSLAAASATVNPQPFTPSAPTVTGIVNVCPYIGTSQQITYTATAAGASGYTWILPLHVTVISGQGTGSITLIFQDSFALNGNKQIRVTANSVCGTSAQTLYVLVAQYPTTPNPITGPTNICPLIGTSTTATYSIPVSPAATTYNWTVPGLTLTAAQGQGTTSITFTYPAGYTSGGPITVVAVNNCGPSGTRSLILAAQPAATPGLISGPSNICPNIAPGGAPATYSIAAVTGATSYTWTVSGVTSFTGQGTTSISFTYPAGYTSGTVNVTATNGCGTGNPRTLATNRLFPATPGNIDVINTVSCPNRQFTYTIAVMPANAISVQWNIPAGATLVSGQGSTSITVSYPAAAVNGSVTAQAVNNCAVSTIRSSAVRLPACPVGFARVDKMTLQGSTPDIESMEVKIFPNPTVSDFQLQVLTVGKEEINVRVLDIQGKLFKTFKLMPYQSITLGAELKAGTYLLELRQGNEIKMTKLVKF